MEYGFIAEFELLRNSRSHQDITREPWTVAAHREITNKYFKILRAREEIKRVNIEMRRLRTSIRDEHLFFRQRIAQLQETDPWIAAEVQVQYNWRARLNVTLTATLDKIEALPGFTGTRGAGTRCGAMSVDGDVAEPHSHCDIVDRAGPYGGVSNDEHDEYEEQEQIEAAVHLSEVITTEPTTAGIPNSMLVHWSIH